MPKEKPIKKAVKKYTMDEAESALYDALPSGITNRDCDIISNFKKCLKSGRKVR